MHMSRDMFGPACPPRAASRSCIFLSIVLLTFGPARSIFFLFDLADNLAIEIMLKNLSSKSVNPIEGREEEFIVKQNLGRGSFGNVYLVTRLSDNMQYALAD